MRPVLTATFAFLGYRARLLAGPFTIGLFYLPIAVALLRPAKHSSAQ